MVSVADLVRETRQHAFGNALEPKNVLGAEYTIGASEVTLRHAVTGLASGDTLEIGYTEFAVLEVNVATKTIALYRVDGTIDRDYPVGTLVTLRPRAPAWRVLAELNNELRSLFSAGLFRTQDIAGTAGALVVPTDATQILAASADGVELRSGFRLWSGVSRETSASGVTVATLVGGTDPDRVTVKRPFAEFTAASFANDAADTSGLAPTALDIPPMGAALRLMVGRESARAVTDTQGETRRAEEVPVGAISSGSRPLEALRRRRVDEERTNLLRRWGARL